MKTLVVANQKGGVGKSAVVSQLAHYARRCGLSVLVLDLDHQQNTTRPLVANTAVTATTWTASDLFVQDAALDLPTAGFVVVPADDRLTSLEKQSSDHNAFATRVRNFLKGCQGFDLCLVDTNPFPDIRYASALISANYVLAPIQLNQEAMEGLAALIGHSRFGVQNIIRALNPDLNFLGILPNLVEPTPFQRNNLQTVIVRFGDLLLRSDRNGELRFGYIPKRSAVAEAQAAGLFLPDLDKTAARDAWREIKPVFDMILSRMDLLPVPEVTA